MVNILVWKECIAIMTGGGGEGGRQENVIRGGGGVVRGLDWMLCKYIRIV